MRVGITGASGFLGSAILAEGQRRGWKIVAFSRRPDPGISGGEERRLLEEPIDLHGLDALIHLAGEPIMGLWTRERKRRIRDSRIRLTEALLAALEGLDCEERPKVLVSASAVGYYGDRGEDWLDEESDVGFGFLAEVCRDWEAAARRAERLGLRVVLPRLGFVLGKGGGLKRLRPLFKWGLGGRLGHGRQWMSWIHVEDVARIFADSVENASIRGAVNCVAPEPVRNRSFTAVYARVLRRWAFLPVPTGLLKHLPGEMASLFLGSQRVEPVALRAYGYTFLHTDLEKALRDLEFGCKVPSST